MNELADRLRLFTSAGAIYLLYVSGGVLPLPEEDGNMGKAAVKAALLVISVILIVTGTIRRSSFQILAAFNFVGMITMGAGLFGSTSLLPGMEKIDGAIACSVVIALLADGACIRHGATALQKTFLIFSFLVLLATVSYKSQFGFFDREVRFLLNGPIVYGWLMGLCALLSMHLWNRSRQWRWAILCACFIVALVWTESKGAALALFAGSASYVALAMRNNRRFWLVTLVSICLVWNFLEDLTNLFDNSRFSVVTRLISGQLLETDDGSIGIRSQLAEEAVEKFKGSPLTGIGLGEFRFEGFSYPHNQHLEIFVELGAFAGVLHFGFVMWSLLRAPPLTRSLILLFAVASTFSGDASYLRFLYSFCLLAHLWPAASRSFGRDEGETGEELNRVKNLIK